MATSNRNCCFRAVAAVVAGVVLSVVVFAGGLEEDNAGDFSSLLIPFVPTQVPSLEGSATNTSLLGSSTVLVLRRRPMGAVVVVSDFSIATPPNAIAMVTASLGKRIEKSRNILLSGTATLRISLQECNSNRNGTLSETMLS